MKEYIERAAALSAVRRAFDDEECDCEVMPVVFKALQEVEAADVVEVRHERWEMVPYNGVYDIRCSSCGYCPGIRFYSSNYCPNCGALMREVGSGEK